MGWKWEENGRRIIPGKIIIPSFGYNYKGEHSEEDCEEVGLKRDGEKREMEWQAAEDEELCEEINIQYSKLLQHFKRTEKFGKRPGPVF